MDTLWSYLTTCIFQLWLLQKCKIWCFQFSKISNWLSWCDFYTSELHIFWDAWKCLLHKQSSKTLIACFQSEWKLWKLLWGASWHLKFSCSWQIQCCLQSHFYFQVVYQNDHLSRHGVGSLVKLTSSFFFFLPTSFCYHHWNWFLSLCHFQYLFSNEVHKYYSSLCYMCNPSIYGSCGSQ